MVTMLGWVYIIAVVAHVTKGRENIMIWDFSWSWSLVLISRDQEDT